MNGRDNEVYMFRFDWLAFATFVSSGQSRFWTRVWILFERRLRRSKSEDTAECGRWEP